MKPEIKNFEVCKRIEKVILSCERQEQWQSCVNWLGQIKLDEVYDDYFIKMIADKSKTLEFV
jgi:hypothetical protein